MRSSGASYVELKAAIQKRLDVVFFEAFKNFLEMHPEAQTGTWLVRGKKVSTGSRDVHGKDCVPDAFIMRPINANDSHINYDILSTEFPKKWKPSRIDLSSLDFDPVDYPQCFRNIFNALIPGGGMTFALPLVMKYRINSEVSRPKITVNSRYNIDIEFSEKNIQEEQKDSPELDEADAIMQVVHKSLKTYLEDKVLSNIPLTLMGFMDISITLKLSFHKVHVYLSAKKPD